MRSMQWQLGILGTISAFALVSDTCPNVTDSMPCLSKYCMSPHIANNAGGFFDSTKQGIVATSYGTSEPVWCFLLDHNEV